MYEHTSRAKTGYKNKLYSAMRKYDNFETEILEKCETYDMAKEKEIIYISKYDSNGIFGYNLTEGGDGSAGYKVSEIDSQLNCTDSPKSFAPPLPRLYLFFLVLHSSATAFLSSY